MSKSEAEVSQDIQVLASSVGMRLFRNNSGMFINDAGNPVRFGLGNISSKVNKQIKSADLIGITPVTITPDMIGQTVGVFTAIEAKKQGWRFSKNGREQAQRKFLDLVESLGGWGIFLSDADQLLVEKLIKGF